MRESETETETESETESTSDSPCPWANPTLASGSGSWVLHLLI